MTRRDVISSARGFLGHHKHATQLLKAGTRKLSFGRTAEWAEDQEKLTEQAEIQTAVSTSQPYPVSGGGHGKACQDEERT